MKYTKKIALGAMLTVAAVSMAACGKKNKEVIETEPVVTETVAPETEAPTIAETEPTIVEETEPEETLPVVDANRINKKRKGYIQTDYFDVSYLVPEAWEEAERESVTADGEYYDGMFIQRFSFQNSKLISKMSDSKLEDQVAPDWVKLNPNSQGGTIEKDGYLYRTFEAIALLEKKGITCTGYMTMVQNIEEKNGYLVFCGFEDPTEEKLAAASYIAQTVTVPVEGETDWLDAEAEEESTDEETVDEETSEEESAEEDENTEEPVEETEESTESEEDSSEEE